MNTRPRDQLDLEGSGASRKRPYSAPRLDHLGDIRALTLGGSPGIGDSGGDEDPLGSRPGSLMDQPAEGATPIPGAKP